MQIEDLTIKQVRELQELLAGRPAIVEPERYLGKQIVVLDRGFVYVGDVTIKGDFVTVKNAKNIRRWGTTKGLGELLEGPLSSTVVDPVEGALLIPARAVIHFIAVKKGW
jgi:hypothetical protein